ncbi:uncharacterized protein LTR77_002056 [Saxophila tyrrhenica]|uniref:Uncharacterized protein n=1 Tax=Saxophila tyrrhenica TaxID=1690608 RepID=A0AAV9PI44_9PEZI|nr:hypothetical protein LTR77_002056 [Saxophila tyrrhenica]
MSPPMYRPIRGFFGWIENGDDPSQPQYIPAPPSKHKIVFDASTRKYYEADITPLPRETAQHNYDQSPTRAAKRERNRSGSPPSLPRPSVGARDATYSDRAHSELDGQSVGRRDGRQQSTPPIKREPSPSAGRNRRPTNFGSTNNQRNQPLPLPQFGPHDNNRPAFGMRRD